MATSSATEKQLTSAITELRRILNKDVALVMEEIAVLGASKEAITELRFLLGKDAKLVLDEIEELGGPTQYKKWVEFSIEDLHMIANNVNKQCTAR